MILSPRQKKLVSAGIGIVINLIGFNSLYAQFSGSVTLGAYHTTNAEASKTTAPNGTIRDTSTPDNVIAPSLDLKYNWDISNPTSILFEVNLNPNFYQTVSARSYLKSLYGITGSFYLSDIEEHPKQATVVIPKENAAKVTTDHPPAKPTIILKPAAPDVAAVASQKLADLSGLLDSFDVETKGISDDSADVASDLKDSVSESVLAMSEILTSEIFTESIAEVLTDELNDQLKLFSQVPMSTSLKEEIVKSFHEIISLLKTSNPQSDILPLPKPQITAESPTPITPGESSSTNDLIAQALAHLQTNGNELSNLSGQNAPDITLINSETMMKDFSSSDVLSKEDLLPLTPKTLATFLSIPVTLEKQDNQGTYAIYSYSIFSFNPRLDYYFSKSSALGISYNLSRTILPFDASHLMDGTENLFRLDSRLELSKEFIFVPELGVAFKSYDNPISYLGVDSIVVTIRPRKIKIDTMTITTTTNYMHFMYGGSLVYFPSSRLVIGIAGALTKSPSLRPYIMDNILTARSKIGGAAVDDEYSYDLTRETAFLLWRAFWDLNLTIDYAYEHRHYANVTIPRRIAKTLKFVSTTAVRNDDGPLWGLNLSKEIFFDSRVIGIFTSFTPSLDIQSMNTTSTLAQFSYKDVTSTLSLEFRF